MLSSRFRIVILSQFAIIHFIFEVVSVRGDWVEIPQGPVKKDEVTPSLKVFPVAPTTIKGFTKEFNTRTPEVSRFESDKQIDRINYGFMDHDLISNATKATKYDNVFLSSLDSMTNKPTIRRLQKENDITTFKPFNIISTTPPGSKMSESLEDDGIDVSTFQEPDEILVDIQPSKDTILNNGMIVNNFTQANETRKPHQTNVKKEEFGILAMLKAVQNTISRSIKSSLKSKKQFLRNLRDKILMMIEDRVEAAWPTSLVTARTSRSDKGHHLDFPSSESALMTISFLTFAVFLIKLVMQLIHAYKPNTMPVITTVGKSASFTNESRLQKRSTEDLETTRRILQSIEFYEHINNGKT